MKNKTFDKKREISRDILVCEKWDKVTTHLGTCNIVRYWLCKNVEIAGNNEEVMEFLGYRGSLSRKIMGDICVKPEDAVDSVVSMYEHELEKQKKIVDQL